MHAMYTCTAIAICIAIETRAVSICRMCVYNSNMGLVSMCNGNNIAAPACVLIFLLAGGAERVVIVTAGISICAEVYIDMFSSENCLPFLE